MSIDLYLAPLAGYSDSAFRLLCREYGAKKLYTEMISIDGLARKNSKTLFYLKTLDNDKPITAQIFGTDLHAYKESVNILNEIDYIDGVNLNFACPVKKVVKTGAGAALLNNLTKMAEIVELVKKHSNKEVSVKIRLGWDKVNIFETVKIIEDIKASYVIIHARTAKQMYSGNADWSYIKELKENSKIKIVGNGDIKTKEDILKYSNYCDAIMIGRAAIGNPYIFSCLNSNFSYDLSKLKKTILKHLEYNQAIYGSNFYINLKKHMVYYLKNISVDKKTKNIYLENILKSTTYDVFLGGINKLFSDF